jgi:elongation factor G
MLRHDTPPPSATAERLGISGAAVRLFKTGYGRAAGGLALARVFGGGLAEGGTLTGAGGQAMRAGAVFRVQGAVTTKVARAEHGDVVAIAKVAAVKLG